MATIRFVLRDGERIVEADRVMCDSQLYVAERRESSCWWRVVTLPRAAVTTVQRRVDVAGRRQWMTEDVRTSAGLDLAAAPIGARPGGGL